MKKILLKTITLLIVLVCSIGLFAACNATLEELQSEYGIVVEGGGFKKGTTLVTEELDLSSNEAQTAIEAVRNRGLTGNMYVFDISALLDGAKVQPNGKVKVTMPAPGEGAIAYDVFHIKDSGACEKLAATYLNGKVSFETDSFSLFVLVEGKDEYKLAVNFSYGGSAALNDEILTVPYMGTIAHNETVTLKAIEDEGYGFDGWYDIYGSVVSYSSTYTFTMDRDLYITAKYVGLVNVMFKAKDKEVLVAIEGSFEYDGKIHSHVQDMWEIGKEYTVKAIPSFGYMFLYWEIEGEEVDGDVYHGVVNGAPGTEFLALAVFEKTDYCLQVNAIGGGKIAEGGEEESTLYKKGFYDACSVTLTAIEDEGYHFVGWFDEEDTCLSTSDSYTINVDGKKKLEARFEKGEAPAEEVTLTATAGEGGTVTDGYTNGKKVDKGTSVTLNATPNDHYSFVGWFVGETKVSDNVNYTFTVNEDTTLVAKFEKNPQANVSITIDPEGSGYFKLADGTTCTKINELMDVDTCLTIEAFENFGYRFSYWVNLDTKKTYGGGNEIELIIPSDGLNYSAVFVEIPHQLIATVVTSDGGDGGMFYVREWQDGFERDSLTEYKNAYEEPNTVQLIAIEKEGYHFVGWFNELKCVSEEESYSVMVTGKTKLEARFEKDEAPAEEVTLTATAGEGGTVTEDYVNGKKVEKGSSVTVTANPSDSYNFVGWFIGETKVSDNETYTFTINEDTTLVAKFEKILRIYITINEEDGGYITQNGFELEVGVSGKIELGSVRDPDFQITLVANAKDGYHFVGWYENGNLLTENATYSFPATEDRNLEADFEVTATEYRFLCDIRGNGCILENNENANEKYMYGTTLAAGSKITLTASPDSSWIFKGWYTSNDEKLISANATYTFELTAHTMVYAMFEENPMIGFFAYCEQPDGGYITENGQPVEFDGERMVASGTQITLTAVENTGYAFKGWYYYDQNQNETLISDKATNTFTVNEPLSVYAKFEEKTMYLFLVQCDAYNGGHLEENLQMVDFGNGRMVDPGTKITLTAIANEGFIFKGWATRDAEWNAIIFSTADTYEFTIDQSVVDEYGKYYVQAIFEEKPNGLKIDAHNAGFTYNENGELVTTVYKIGSDIQPKIEYVGVYATYESLDMQDKYLTLNEDYTRDLGGLDFTKAGTYTVTYTYKADTSLTVSLTVQVVA